MLGGGCCCCETDSHPPPNPFLLPLFPLLLLLSWIPVAQARTPQAPERSGSVKTRKASSSPFHHHPEALNPRPSQAPNPGWEVISLKKLGVDDIVHFDFMEPWLPRHPFIWITAAILCRCLDSKALLTPKPRDPDPRIIRLIEPVKYVVCYIVGHDSFSRSMVEHDFRVPLDIDIDSPQESHLGHLPNSHLNPEVRPSVGFIY